MRILIVDDDVISRKILQKILLTYGECYFAEDGSEAIYMFKQSLKNKKKYDMICLDINMPVLDGRQVLKQIRKIEEKNSINGSDRVKILMATALDDSKNIMGSFNSGCEGYIVKPFNSEKIVKQMENLFGSFPAKETRIKKTTGKSINVNFSFERIENIKYLRVFINEENIRGFEASFLIGEFTEGLLYTSSRIVFDFSNTRFIDSSCLGALINLTSKANTLGKNITIKVSKTTMNTIKLAGMDRIIPVE